MKPVNYILVNETNRKNPVAATEQRDVPNIGLCLVVNAGAKWNVPGSRERVALTERLVNLRRHYPETPILGLSELDTSAKYAPVRVNPEMNALRRELSDLP